MNDDNGKIVERFREFAVKLKSGEPIEATRVEMCHECHGNGVAYRHGDSYFDAHRVVCNACGGTGFIRTKVTYRVR